MHLDTESAHTSSPPHVCGCKTSGQHIYPHTCIYTRTPPPIPPAEPKPGFARIFAKLHPGVQALTPTLTNATCMSMSNVPHKTSLPVHPLAQSIDSKKEEFRKYLESNGVVDALTKGAS